MLDFKKLDIIEISRYLKHLLETMPQRPCLVFANSINVLLAEYSKH